MVIASDRQTSASASLSWCERRTATAYSSWKPPPPTGQRTGSGSASAFTPAPCAALVATVSSSGGTAAVYAAGGRGRRRWWARKIALAHLGCCILLCSHSGAECERNDERVAKHRVGWVVGVDPAGSDPNCDNNVASFALSFGGRTRFVRHRAAKIAKRKSKGKGQLKAESLPPPRIFRSRKKRTVDGRRERRPGFDARTAAWF